MASSELVRGLVVVDLKLSWCSVFLDPLPCTLPGEDEPTKLRRPDWEGGREAAARSRSQRQGQLLELFSYFVVAHLC